MIKNVDKYIFVFLSQYVSLLQTHELRYTYQVYVEKLKIRIDITNNLQREKINFG